jgi:hypothetical protein
LCIAEEIYEFEIKFYLSDRLGQAGHVQLPNSNEQLKDKGRCESPACQITGARQLIITQP